MATFAGKTVSRDQIRGTIALLSHYRKFLASDFERCRDLEGGWSGGALTKPEARRRLAFLVHTAINRKAGVPDVAGRKQESGYQASLWRDCRAVRDRVNRRVIVRQFETAEIRGRFGHLLSGWDD